MKKKKILLGLLIASGIFSLAGCAKEKPVKPDDTKTEETSKPIETSSSTETSKPTTTEAPKPTETTSSKPTETTEEVSYTMHVTNPKTGEIEDIVAKNGVVSGLEDCGNFTLTDDLFVTEYKHTGYTYNFGEEIKNGDIISEDIYVYPTQDIVNRVLNDKTTEKVDVRYRIDEILDFYEDKFDIPETVLIYNKEREINEYLYLENGEYVADEINQLIMGGYKNSPELLAGLYENMDGFKFEYDNNGFYISEVDEENDTSVLLHELDLNLLFKKTYLSMGLSPLVFDYAYTFGLKEITENEFLEMYDNFETPNYNKVKVDANQENYYHGVYSTYSNAVFEYDNEQYTCISAYNDAFPYGLIELLDYDSKEMANIGEETKYYIGHNCVVIKNENGEFTYNLDGTLRSYSYSYNYDDDCILTDSKYFTYYTDDEILDEEISFNEFFSAIYNEDRRKTISFRVYQKPIDASFRMTLLSGDNEYSLLEGESGFTTLNEVEATLYGSKGIIYYILSSADTASEKFYKTKTGYCATFTSNENSYTVNFDSFGYVTEYKVKYSNNSETGIVYVNQTNEEFGYVEIIDPISEETTTSFARIKESIEIPSKPYGKMEGDIPMWYNPSYVVDENGESFMAGFVRPGRTTYTIHYDVGRCLLLEMYTSLDTSTPMDLVPFLRDTKFYDDNKKEYFFDVPSEKGYVVEGYYSDSSFTTPFDFTKAYTENTKIYAKLEAMTLSNYSIMGTGVVGDNYWFQSITTNGSTDPVKTNLGCIEMTGTISAVRTANEIETNLTQRTTLEFDTASDGEMTITLGTDCLQVYYHVGYTAPPQTLFNSGIVYRRMGTSFFQLSSPEGGADYYFKINLTKSVVDGKYQYTIPTKAEKVLLFFTNNTILYDLKIEYTE